MQMKRENGVFIAFLFILSPARKGCKRFLRFCLADKTLKVRLHFAILPFNYVCLKMNLLFLWRSLCSTITSIQMGRRLDH